MSKISDDLRGAFLREVTAELRNQEVEPDNTLHRTNAQRVAEMVRAMIIEEDLILFMYSRFLDLTAPLRPDFGKALEAAKAAGISPQIEIRPAGDALDGDTGVVN